MTTCVYASHMLVFCTIYVHIVEMFIHKLLKNVYGDFDPAIREGRIQAIISGRGSWSQGPEGGTKEQGLYRFGPPKHKTLCHVSVVLFVLQRREVQAWKL